MNTQQSLEYFRSLTEDSREQLAVEYLTTQNRVFDDSPYTPEQALRYYRSRPREVLFSYDIEKQEAFIKWIAVQQQVQWLRAFISVWDYVTQNGNVVLNEEHSLSLIYQTWCMTSEIAACPSADDLLHDLTTPPDEDEADTFTGILLEMNDANDDFTGSKQCRFTLREFLHDNSAPSVDMPTVDEIRAVVSLQIGDIAHVGQCNRIKRIR